MIERRCRSCEARLTETFVDLGVSPVSNALLPVSKLSELEPFFPLHVFVCSVCFLVQLQAFHGAAEIFTDDYAYFSSYSTTWLAHAKSYVDAIAIRLGLGASDLVVEVASNDGYLLQYVVARGVRALGVEPAANVARAAESRGVPTLVEFFGSQTAQRIREEFGQARLIVANNVIAHVPNLNDFVAGLKVLLADDGLVTVEFPHLLNLVRFAQFDTIYHEHFSYFSLLAAQRAFARANLIIVDVEELPTHGGSLRIFVAHRGRPNIAVSRVLAEESGAGLECLETYHAFGAAVGRVKRDLLRFLIDAKESGKRVVAYGAAAKGSTLLNYCGVRTDFIDFIADVSERKQGYYMPGVHIPIVAPAIIEREKPDYVIILPWNLREEIALQLAVIRTWGGKFVVPIPRLEVF